MYARPQLSVLHSILKHQNNAHAWSLPVSKHCWAVSEVNLLITLSVMLNANIKHLTHFLHSSPIPKVFEIIQNIIMMPCIHLLCHATTLFEISVQPKLSQVFCHVFDHCSIQSLKTSNTVTNTFQSKLTASMMTYSNKMSSISSFWCLLMKRTATSQTTGHT